MTTPWLALNGINLGAMASIAGAKSARRDVGQIATTVDGSLNVSRSKRKHDLSFDSVPLSGDDAFAWESLLIGEGEVWNFDDSLFGTKGLGPSAVSGAARNSSSPKFGTDMLRVPGSTGTITFPGAGLNSAGVDNGSTVMFWRNETGWHHYTITKDGAAWKDGVRNDSLAAPAWLTFGAAGTGDVTISHDGSTTVDYDDLVILPFRVLNDWPPIWGVATTAFSPLPHLNATGAMVRENYTLNGATPRVVIGTCSDAAVLVGRRSSSLQHDLRRLVIELKEV